MADGAIVLDNGTRFIKAGFAYETAPRITVSNIVGRPRDKRYIDYGFLKEAYVVYKELDLNRFRLNMQCPITNGMVTNWDDMETIWHHTFNELHVEPKDHPVLLTEPPTNPKDKREKMTEMMFEKFDIPAMYASNQSVMSLFASGRTTGIVVESGHGVSHTVPIYEGSAIPYCTRQFNIAGHKVTEYLHHILTHSRPQGLYLDSYFGKEIVRDIKEELAYVSLDYQYDLANPVERTYVLPNGKPLTIRDELFRCAEILFQPSLTGLDLNTNGIHQTTFKSIAMCAIEIKKDLYRNIVLSGGSTMLPGFANRMRKEITALAPANMKIKVVAPPERNYTVWLGGAVQASLSNFPQMWISKAEYNEFGPSIVHKKYYSDFVLEVKKALVVDSRVEICQLVGDEPLYAVV